MTPQAQLDECIDHYPPEIAKLTRAALKKMRARLPHAWQLVYDNYNALAIGFSPTEKTGDVIFSLALYPRWVTLFFFHATKLPDPQKILKGSGSVVRSVVLKSAAELDTPAIGDLMNALPDAAPMKFDRKQKSQLVIRSISEKQRPRRPKGL